MHLLLLQLLILASNIFVLFFFLLRTEYNIIHYTLIIIFLFFILIHCELNSEVTNVRMQHLSFIVNNIISLSIIDNTSDSLFSLVCFFFLINWPSICLLRKVKVFDRHIVSHNIYHSENVARKRNDKTKNAFPQSFKMFFVISFSSQCIYFHLNISFGLKCSWPWNEFADGSMLLSNRNYILRWSLVELE